MGFDLIERATDARLRAFAGELRRIQGEIGFKVSARGWCYILEQQARAINKDQFDKAEAWVNRCRKRGLLPIDFVADEPARRFSGVEIPEEQSPAQHACDYLRACLQTECYYTPDWWDGERFYIQMLVEKVDLITLFEPVCRVYHVPIATSKGWGSMLQRAEYARRFAEAEERGLECVLLYCGDHDPDGLRIAEFLRKNIADLKKSKWDDGTPGYDPGRLTIERFGINMPFIEEHRLTWIDNLITGTGGDLASPNHKNHGQAYVQRYLAEVGARKCEANALVTMPETARDLCREAIEGYLGTDAIERFDARWQRVADEMRLNREAEGLDSILSAVIGKFSNA